MKYMYQLTTNSIFCSEVELKFLANGMSEPVDGLLSVSGNEDKFKRVKSFRLDATKITSIWQE